MKEDIGKYRPISLTSFPDKMMEKMLLEVTEKYLRTMWSLVPATHVHEGKGPV